MRVVGYVLLAALGVLVLLLLAAVIRTLCMKKKTSDYTPHPDAAREREYAEKLSRMVAYETVSHPDDPELEKFRGFHKLLAELYPTVHEKLEKTEIDGNLLFFWEGKNHDRPLVLMSHQDVVPAEGTWEHAPFSGDIADGKVWGRGASDTKCSVMGFFQACEELLREGYVPEQDVYLSSSCTEEFAGPGGGKLVDELRRRGVKPFLVCDEGGGIISEPIGGIHGNFAMLGVFEKGKADVRFTARSNGGHASAPPKNSPVARLAAFVDSMEKHPPFRKKFEPEVSAMFARLAAYAPFALRLLFGNLWLFAPLMKLVMHNGGLHDALRFGRLQRAAAGGKRVGQSPVHPAPGNGREPRAYQKARGKVRYRDRRSLRERLFCPRGYPRRGVAARDRYDRRGVSRPCLEPVCHDRRDGREELSGDLR